MRKALLLVVFACALMVAPSALAAGGPSFAGVRFLEPNAKLTLEATGVTPSPRSFAAPSAAATTPPIGTTKTWLGLNDVTGRVYTKPYTLRGVGGNVEVWVADDLSFPAGDCRNDSRTTITDDQVSYFIGQFDGNIYPKESTSFSTPPPRDGSAAILPGLIGAPPDYYAGKADDIVVLIDNVRDTNYFDPNNSQSLSYIAGFFSGQLNEYFDRNVMTVDAFDWLHRTGATPPDEPVAGDTCNSKPARPFLYEGVFAHEYQHLLEYYEDVDETSWVNEGLSDSAIELTGYGQPAAPITDSHFDSHIQCFLGWLGVSTPANPNPRPESGPENSLTIWGDQGDDEILCDYGAAYSFMLYLKGRFGEAFLTALHREDANGLVGLQNVLTEFVSRDSAQTVVHRWAATMALDGVLDRSRFRLLGNDYRIPTLDATINWDTPEAYSSPGAPPNGSDYVRLRDASGRYLGARDVRSLSFDGAPTLEPRPVEWTVDSGTLYSGTGDLLDRAIVRKVNVPSTSAVLAFDTRWNLEETWDFAFVQVSTDGGATYRSVTCADSRSDFDPQAHPTVQANVPGFTGVQDWKSETCDLSAFAGQTVYLAFRDVTDWSTEGNEGAPFAPGWWVKNVTLGGTLVDAGTSLAGWSSPTQVHPTAVAGFTVQLVVYDSRHRWPALLVPVPLDRRFHASVDIGRLRRLIPRAYDVVSALVMYDEPTETILQSARYTLRANGVTQPGG